jgi:hypothetical protein
MTRARTTQHQSQRTKSRRRARGPSKRTSTRKPAAKKSAARRSRRTTARLNGGVWADYIPGYSYLTVTRPAQIKQAESDELQEALGWGDFQAPPQIGPATPVKTNNDEYPHVFVV